MVDGVGLSALPNPDRSKFHVVDSGIGLRELVYGHTLASLPEGRFSKRHRLLELLGFAYKSLGGSKFTPSTKCRIKGSGSYAVD